MGPTRWCQAGICGVIVNVDNRQINDGGYYGTLRSDHEVMAVTGACLAVRSDLYREIGGFSEDSQALSMTSISVSKLLNGGYRNIAANTVEMYHYESLTPRPRSQAERTRQPVRALVLAHAAGSISAKAKPASMTATEVKPSSVASMRGWLTAHWRIGWIPNCGGCYLCSSWGKPQWSSLGVIAKRANSRTH